MVKVGGEVAVIPPCELHVKCVVGVSVPGAMTRVATVSGQQYISVNEACCE